MDEVLPERRKAVAWLVGRGLTRATALDLVGDAIAVCVGRERRPDDPAAFFWRVVTRLLNRYLRTEHPIARMTTELIEDLAVAGATPLDRVCGAVLEEQVEAVLETCSGRAAEVARLHLKDTSMSLAAVGRELGIAPSTTRRHWSVAKKALEALAEDLGLAP